MLNNDLAINKTAEFIMSTKKKWSKNYVLYGFTCARERDGTQRSQRIFCNVKLSNSSLVPTKLREDFTKVYGSGKLRTP